MNSHERDLSRLTTIIGEKIVKGAQKIESLFSSVSIYRVPGELRKLKESAYTPRLITIGPLHRDDEHLQTPIQHVKFSYTNNLFCRLTKGIEDPESAMEKKFLVLKECVEIMKMLIHDARKCYAEEVILDEEMLLVDGCFILELIYRYNYQQAFKTEPPLRAQDHRKSSSEEYMADSILHGIFSANIVRSDLLLFENQIPYFVLEKLFSVTIDKIPNISPDKITLNNLIRVYFGEVMNPKQNSTANGSTTTINCGSRSDHVFRVFGNKKKNPREDEVVSSSANYYHILHKLHEDSLPRHETNKADHTELMPSASNLYYATVKFVPSAGNDLLRVKFSEPEGLFWWFHSALFEIPTLIMDDNTEVFLRNIIAFEQCCHEVSKHFTSYAYLMNVLLNSKKDVEVLEKAGVMRNYLGASENVIDLFNKLCKETILGEFYFPNVCNKATEYSKRSWQKTKAYWRRIYFADPWQFIAIYLSFISLFASIVQVVIAVMSLK